jgi:transcriptional regulator with XRE-family HTH domain
MNSPIRMLIGSRIRSHRKAMRISQAALAEALDLEPTTLSRYERGDYSPDGEQLIRLSNFFGVSPLDFLPTAVETQWQAVVELRSILIDLVYRINDPDELERLISTARGSKQANLR